MAVSASNPRLSNPIKSDVPEIQQKEAALLKMDPTNIADLEVGSKRLTEISSGNWQFQMWNGSQWVNVGKLKMDVDTVDGYDASITPKANTLAVRGSDGKLLDSITGNAATADTAVSLSQTLVVGKGGTGATTSEQARENLGVPPTNHASVNTTYGLSSESKYGHAKASSDEPTQDTDNGAVGVKLSEFARGDHSHKKVLGNADTYGQVKLTDSVSDESAASSHIGASAKAVKTAYDKAVDASDEATTVMQGASASSAGASGRVPAPAKGAQNRPLRGDGTWANTLDARLLSSLVDFVALVGRNDGTSRLSLRSQKDTNGASLNLYGINCDSLGGGALQGAFQLLAARSSSDYKALLGTPSGNLIWDNHHVLNGSDVAFYGILPNGAVQYLPDGGSWGLLRLQATSTGAVASFYAGRLAGGSAVNVKNGNTQVIIAIRTSY